MAGYGLNRERLEKENSPHKVGEHALTGEEPHVVKLYRWRPGVSNCCWKLSILIYIIVVRVNRPPMDFPQRESKFFKSLLFPLQKQVPARRCLCASPRFRNKILLSPMVLTTFSKCLILFMHEIFMKKSKSCWSPHFTHFLTIAKTPKFALIKNTSSARPTFSH